MSQTEWLKGYAAAFPKPAKPFEEMSDAEVIAHCIERLGLNEDQALEQLEWIRGRDASDNLVPDIPA